MRKIKFKEISVLDKASIIEQIKVNLEQYTKKEHKLGGFISLAGINACSFLENVVDDLMLILGLISNQKSFSASVSNSDQGRLCLTNFLVKARSNFC